MIALDAVEVNAAALLLKMRRVVDPAAVRSRVQWWTSLFSFDNRALYERVDPGL